MLEPYRPYTDSQPRQPLNRVAVREAKKPPRYKV